MKRLFLSALGIVVLVGIAAAMYWRPDRALEVASGLMAHNVCSATFISGLNAKATADELIKPMLPEFVGPLQRYHVDQDLKTVEASVAGLEPMRATYVSGFGCRLVLDPLYSGPVAAVSRAASPTDSFAPPTQVAGADPAIDAALTQEFTERPSQRPRYVKAIVIVKDGRVVAERYAPGFTLDTPVGAPEWKRSGDARGALVVDDLLRMDSGIDAAETGSGFDLKKVPAQ